MIRSDDKSAEPAEMRDLRERAERIRLAAADGVRAALRRHMLLGESVVVAGDNGGVRWLGPEEIRRALNDEPEAGAGAPSPAGRGSSPKATG